MTVWTMGKAGAVFGLLALVGVGRAHGQESPSIQTVELAPDVVLFHTPGPVGGILVGNSVLFTRRGASVLIDTGIDDRAGDLGTLIEAQGQGPLHGVINTHPHLDHSGGNGLLATSRGIEPNVVLESLDPSAVSSYRGIVHSSADVAVHLVESNVLILGDVYPGRGYPFLAVDAGATWESLLAMLDWAIERSDSETVVVPGHGPPETVRELREFRKMVEAVGGRVTDWIEAGLSEDDAVARKPSQDFDSVWGAGFLSPDDWVRQVYRVIVSRP